MSPEAQFRQWYVESMEPLRTKGHAGFIFMLTAFPLLERYLRRKSNTPDGALQLEDDFYSELVKLFPDIEEKKKEFWRAYRNGLVHQGTLSTTFKKRSGVWEDLPNAEISGDDARPAYYSADKNAFFVNPTALFDRVIDAILSDFSTYERAESYPLPATWIIQTSPESGPEIFLGTGVYRLNSPASPFPPPISENS